ncbi:MAG: Ig-like domain-containing protein [Cyanobacteria bacterium J06592_8]
MVFAPENTIIDTLDVNILVGTSGSDLIQGLTGDDLILGAGADDQLLGNQGVDTVYGHQGNDIIYGGSGADLLFGGQGDDSIFGDNGNDTIYADQGADSLTGGDGTDVFVLETGTDNSSTTTTDLIVDFNVDEDQIEFQNGLTFEDFSIEETPFGDTVILEPISGEILAVLQGVNRDSFIEAFLPTPPSEETIVEEPIVTASLDNDTGLDDRDNITSDPTVTGTVINGDAVADLEISIGESFVPTETNIAADGSFTLTQEQLEEALNISFTDGSYTIQIRTVDSSESQLSEPIELTFTIAPDGVPPEQEIEFFPSGIDFLTPTITAELSNDNGANDSDGITSDLTITGTAIDNWGVAELEVSIGEEFVTIETNIAADGSFTLTPEQLEETFDISFVNDDTYTVFLRAVDTSGLRSLSLSEVTFTFDPTLVDTQQEGDSSDPVDDEQEGGTSDPVDDEQEGGTSDPVDDEQEGDSSDPVDDEQEGDSSDPVDDEQESGTSDPVDDEQSNQLVNEITSTSSAAIWTGNLESFGTAISDLWDEGYRLVDVEYAEDTWFGSFQEDTGGNAYSTATTGDEFLAKVQERWDDGFDLVDVEYGDDLWFLTFRGDSGRNGYNTATTGDEFQTEIQEQWDDGLGLVDFEYVDGLLVSIFQEDTGGNAFVPASSLDEFQTKIQERWDDGFDLVDVEYGNGTWFGVFLEDTGRNGYTTASSLDEFQTQIQEKWDDGLDLVDVGYGDGTWFGVFQEETAPSSSSSGSFVNNFYDNYFDLWTITLQEEALLAAAARPILPL